VCNFPAGRGVPNTAHAKSIVHFESIAGTSRSADRPKSAQGLVLGTACFHSVSSGSGGGRRVYGTFGQTTFVMMLAKLLHVLTLAAGSAASSPTLTSGNVSSVTVFTKGELGYVGMRIPSILMIPQGVNKGHLLAFCECGQPHAMESQSRVDTGCDICSKSSVDSGATWGPLQVVIKNSSQPSPVYDTATSTIVLNFNGAPHCLDQTTGCGFNQQMISTDDGKTWGAPTPLDQFLGAKGHAAAGPGVGIQLTQGEHKGRLLFIGHRGAYVQDSVWFTDDAGKTYSTSDTILQAMDEAQLVENLNGTIIANMRHKDSPTKGRAVATSTDGGKTFSKIEYDSQLVASVCQATIIRSSQNGAIYFANPAAHHGRTHGKVRRSETGLVGSWGESSFDVTDGGFGYSCLTDVAEKGKLGLLWEGRGGIVFSLVPLDF
jgi:sialidase-1